MTTLAVEIKRTPLHESHLVGHAKMVPFGGWEMPLQYEQGILDEYNNTRNAVAVFDTSHMGEFLIEGDCHECGLDRIVTQAISQMPAGTCLYGVMLNKTGGVIDDLIVYRSEPKRFMLVVNASTTQRDEQHIRTNLSSSQALTDLSQELGKLDIQGPKAKDVLEPFIPGIGRLEYYAFAQFSILGEDALVSRTGYTGELGYEIYYPWDKMPRLWEKLMELKVAPAGLGARDVLRLEMGYPLYGHELSEDFSPLKAGLNRFLDLKKEFIGKEALLKEMQEGVSEKLVAFVANNRRSPRAGQPIRDVRRQMIGVVTSGSFSPFFSAGIGLGYVGHEKASVGDEILIGDLGNPVVAKIRKKPLYQHGTFKN